LSAPPPRVSPSVPDGAAAAGGSVWDALEHALSPVEECPRLVAGTEAAHHTTRAGAPYVVIHNPAARTYLKLDPREHALLALMDGAHTVMALVVEYFLRHGELALPRIAGLVQLLRAHHFLTEPPLDAFAALDARLRGFDAGTLPRRLAAAFLQARIGWRGADRALGAWYRAWGRFLFARPAARALAFLALLGPVLLSIEFQRGRYDPFRAGDSYVLGAVLLWLLTTLGVALHELGHGLAVKHAGRAVSSAGVMLYYGAPAAFVDTTDVWMAPRRLRLLVSLAGPWTELVLGGLCAGAVLLLPTGPAGAFLFAAAFVLVLGAALQFYPLLELDGYYLLVDLLEKPMLRARALAFVRGPLWRRLRRRAPLTGEERFFALFGLASAASSVLFVAVAVQLWRHRALAAVQEGWATGHPLVRVAVALAVALCAAPLVLGLWRLVGGLAGRTALRLGWLRRRAAARRHRAALAALRAVSLWAEVPEARLLEVARAMRVRNVPGGETVVCQGEPGDAFYVIARGVFEVLVDGRPVRRLGRGDYFGERALLADTPRTATVVALADGRLFALDRAAFHATLAHEVATRERLEAALAYRAAVAAIPLFRDLAPAELDLLLTRLVSLSAAAGRTIVRQGAPGDRFYVIRAGEVDVVRDGRVVRTLGPGDAFGEVALLLDVPRTATVRATAPTELLALSAQDFRDLLARYCGRGDELTRLSQARLAADHELRRAG
jgi:CRP-like cAMP-binding protein